MTKLDNKTMRKDVASKIIKLFDKIDVTIERLNNVPVDTLIKSAQQTNNFLNLSVELFNTYMDYLYHQDKDLYHLSNDVYLFIDELSEKLITFIGTISKNIDLSSDEYNDNELRYWVKSYTNITKFIKDVYPLKSKFSWEISRTKNLKKILDNAIDLEKELRNKRSLIDIVNLADNEKKLIKYKADINTSEFRLSLINLAINKNYILLVDMDKEQLKKLQEEYSHLNVITVYNYESKFIDSKPKYDFSKKYLLDYKVYYKSIPFDKLEIATGFIKDELSD